MTLKIQQGNTTIILLSEHVIQSTRFINMRLSMILTKIDGSIGDYATKVNKIAGLSDEMFSEFDRIRRESMELETLNEPA